MKQNEKNIQKDQELTKEELENVNGGGKHLNIRRGHGVWSPCDPDLYLYK